MTFADHPIYQAPARGVVAGALFLHVPMVFRLTTRLPVLSPLASGLVQVNPDFDEAWRMAPPAAQAEGVPVAALAKPRPVVVLAVGAAEDDPAHAHNVWVLPSYSVKERPRAGRNLFPLPAWDAVGLATDGYLDFFQVATIPMPSLRGRPHPCDLRPTVFDGLLAKFRACLRGER